MGLQRPRFASALPLAHFPHFLARHGDQLTTPEHGTVARDAFDDRFDCAQNQHKDEIDKNDDDKGARQEVQGIGYRADQRLHHDLVTDSDQDKGDGDQPDSDKDDPQTAQIL